MEYDRLDYGGQLSLGKVKHLNLNPNLVGKDTDQNKDSDMTRIPL